MNQMSDDNLNNQNDFDQFDNFDVNGDDQAYGDDLNENEKPKSKSKALVTVLFLLILAGVCAAGYTFYFKPLLTAQAPQGDGVPPGGAVGADNESLPPSVTTGDVAANPVGDALTPPPAPDVAADAIPTPPPAIGNDGTVPADVSVDALAAPEAAPAAPTSDNAAPADALANSTLPAPTADAAAPANATVEAPSRIAAPDDIIASDTINPTLPAPTAGNGLTPVTPPADAPVAAIASTETKDMIAPEEVPAAVTPTAVAVAAPAADNAKVTALEAKVAALPSADAIAKLTSKLDSLTQRLDALDKRTETLATALQDKEAAAPVERKVTVPSQDVVDAPASAPAPVKKAAPKKPVVKAKPVAKSTSQWQLRSAQPDAAWLSKPGSEEMVRYAVGQTLPGSGKVTAIAQENGVWVVKTDSGVTIRP